MELAPSEQAPEPPAGELPSAQEPVAGEEPEALGEVAVGAAVPSSTPARRNGRYDLLVTSASAAIVAFAAVGIFVLGMFVHSRVDSGNGSAVVQVVQPTGAAQPTAAPTVAPTVDDDPAQGPEDAPVTIIEFSDFQCPYCARFQSQTLPQIMQNFGDKVRFVYRDFPLTSLHANALKAAEASECAHEQGKYWEYHDLLFQNQAALDVDSLKSYAASLGLDPTAFNNCLDTDATKGEVAKDVQDGNAAGVQGTPAFFINGTLLTGAQPYANFQAAIESALAAAGG